jgi:hypothetical protein
MVDLSFQFDRAVLDVDARVIKSKILKPRLMKTRLRLMGNVHTHHHSQGFALACYDFNQNGNESTDWDMIAILHLQVRADTS